MKLLTCALVIICIARGLCSITPIVPKGTIRLNSFSKGNNVPHFLHKPVSTHSSLSPALSIRGGSVTNTIYEAFQTTSSFGAVRDSISNFLMGYLVEPWSATPPVTKSFIGLSFLLTTVAAVFNNNEWPEEFQFDVQKIFNEFQIWRPFTSFLYLGSMGINYLLTLQFLWTYMSQLEKLMIKAPAEYLMMLLFGSTSLLGTYLYFDLPSQFLGHNLAAYLVYIWSKIFEGMYLPR